MSATLSANEYFTARQFCEHIGIQPITASKWRARGCGPAFCRIGRTIRYAKADVDAFVARNTIGKVQP